MREEGEGGDEDAAAQRNEGNENKLGPGKRNNRGRRMNEERNAREDEVDPGETHERFVNGSAAGG